MPTAGETLNNFNHGAISPQLSVWRHLNIEQDTMTNPFSTGDALGDISSGNITNINIGAGVATVQMDGAVWDDEGDISGQGDQFKGGWLVSSGLSYPILGNTAIDGVIGLGTNTAFPANGAFATIYQDDFLDGQSRVDVSNAAPLYTMLQKSNQHTKNKFAEAYIETNLTALDGFDSQVSPETHSVPSDTIYTNARGTAVQGSKTRMFWSVYLSTAFEGPVESDGDGSQEQQTETYSPFKGYTDKAETTSIVYLETVRDAGQRPPELELPLIAAHEIGHQLGLSKGKGADANLHRNGRLNLMSSGVLLDNAVNKADFKYDYIRLHPADIAALRRRVVSPGT